MVKKKKELPELSRAEFDIMRALWEGGRLSAREVHDRVSGDYDWAYSTTRTMLERMVSKDYLKRETFHGVLLFSPAISRAQGVAHAVRELADRLLGANHGALVALFAKSSSLSRHEVKELEHLLERDGKERP